MSARAQDWLTVKFVQEVLRRFEDDESLEVHHLTKRRAIAEGENFTSDMIRAYVEYSSNKSGRKIIAKKSMIVKISPFSKGVQKDLVTQIGAFDTEIKMFTTTLAKMNNFLNEKGCRFNPDVLYTEVGNPSIVVMEDLSVHKYRMADRQACLDLEHSILTVQKIAKFHATSVALFEQDPTSMTTYVRGIFHHDNVNQFKRFFSDAVKILGNEVLSWSELGSSARDCSEKLLKLSKVCYERAVECREPKQNEFNVLNHGDLWTNNMLFRYNDNGKVIDHIFVDFQCCVWSSPAIDLCQFFDTSLSENVYHNHRSTLLEEYLNVLTATMSRLQCTTKPPSMTTLKKILMDRELLSVIWSIASLRILFDDKNRPRTFDTIFERQDDDVQPTPKESLYRKVIQKRLLDWNARGVIDF